jgi:hypothetical protein
MTELLVDVWTTSTTQNTRESWGIQLATSNFGISSSLIIITSQSFIGGDCYGLKVPPDPLHDHTMLTASVVTQSGPILLETFLKHYFSKKAGKSSVAREELLFDEGESFTSVIVGNSIAMEI